MLKGCNKAEMRQNPATANYERRRLHSAYDHVRLTPTVLYITTMFHTHIWGISILGESSYLHLLCKAHFV